MSLFGYDTVNLHLLKTTEFKMGQERDPSNTDTLWQTYDIWVEGIPIDTGGSLVAPSAATIADIKHILNTPRRALRYQVAGEDLVYVPNPPDAGMGPEPLGASVRQMTSDAIFVRVGFRVRVRDCATGNPDPVVSLRWESKETFDENWYSRISTSGRLIVRSDMRKNADSFRALAVPPVPTNFRRLSSDYTMNRAGTELDFAFVDQEQYVMVPPPARKASGRAMVSVQKGGKRFGQVDVHLESGPGVNRSDLMLMAVRIAYSKLTQEGIANLNLLEGKFAESLWENVVDVSLSATLQPMTAPTFSKIAAAAAVGAGGGGGMVPSPFRSAGINPGAGPVQPQTPDLRSRGTVAGLLAALFRDPCAAAVAGATTGTATALDNAAVKKEPQLGVLKNNATPGGTSLAPSGSGSSGGLTPYAGEFRLLSAIELPTASPGGIADAAPYDYYEIESEYTKDAGVRQLPGTGSGSSGGQSAFVTVHGGQMSLVCTFACKRQNKPPVLPREESADSNYVFLGSVVTPAGIEIGADAVTPVYAVSGTYTYGVVDPDKVTLFAPFPPFLSSRLGSLVEEAAGYVARGVLWQFAGRGDQQDENNPPAAPGRPAGNGAGGFAGGGDFGGGGNFTGPPVNP